MNGISAGASDSPPALNEPGISAPRQALKPSIPWKKIGAVAGTIVAVVGAVTGVIQIVQAVNRNMSSVDTIVVSAAMVDDAITEWAVPGDRLEDFPSDSAACGPRQAAWLEANGTALDRRIDVQMRNTASEGAMVVVDYFEAQFSSPDAGAEAFVLTICDPAGTPGAPRQFARVNTGPEPAFYQRPIGQGEPPAPISRVTWNLAPGETGTVRLHVFSTDGASGNLNATLIAGDDEEVVGIEGSDFSVPPLLFGGEVALYATADGLVCEQLAQSIRTPCTLDGVMSALERRG